MVLNLSVATAHRQRRGGGRGPRRAGYFGERARRKMRNAHWIAAPL